MPLRFAGPTPSEPGDESTLLEPAVAYRFDCLGIACRCFVPEPFIPMAANSLNGAAQQRPGAKAFDAPVPEGPEPDETQRTLRGRCVPRQVLLMAGRRMKRNGIRSVTFNDSQSAARSSGKSASRRYSPSTDKLA